MIAERLDEAMKQAQSPSAKPRPEGTGRWHDDHGRRRRPKRVDTLKHKSVRRKNIPTQENSSFMHEEDAAPVRLQFPRRYSPATHPELYKRNADLDPQLVWRGNNAGEGDVQLVWKGKDEEDAAAAQVDAAPIYIQEKVHPKAIIDDIRRRQEGFEDWKYENDAPDLFADFNGIPDIEDKLKYYEHDAVGLKWSNRLILGDSLAVMASLAEKEGLRGKVQMIYLDPPYGIKFNSNWQVSTRDREVKDGKTAHSIARTRGGSGLSRHVGARDPLLPSLSARSPDCSRDLLSDTGVVFVQIGDENLHLVRALLDEVFGRRQFRIARLSFKKTRIRLEHLFARCCDYILWYAKDIEAAEIPTALSDEAIGGDGANEYTSCRTARLLASMVCDRRENRGVDHACKARVYCIDNLTSSQAADRRDHPWFGIDGRSISCHGKGIMEDQRATASNRLDEADRLMSHGKHPSYRAIL